MRITSDIGSRVPPPATAVPAVDFSSFGVVDTMIDAGNPSCCRSFPDANSARRAAFSPSWQDGERQPGLSESAARQQQSLPNRQKPRTVMHHQQSLTY
jgi:hypothetical protein